MSCPANSVKSADASFESGHAEPSREDILISMLLKVLQQQSQILEYSRQILRKQNELMEMLGDDDLDDEELEQLNRPNA